MTPFIVILVLVVVAAALAQFMVFALMKKVLRKGAKVAIEMAWKKVHAHSNPVLKVIEADKILDEALRLLGYTGSLGDKLKAAGPRLNNINALWSAHKLRNRLVHELDVKVGDREVEKAIQTFRHALKDLGANI